MTHFRGQIRGPHWGPAMDNMLIDFWRKHECLFNSGLDSYYNKDSKTRLWGEFASSIGKPVCDVERRSRSLRTQYGRALWHQDEVSTAQQKMLREKLGFLRPYIVRRRCDSFLDDDELETEGTMYQEMGNPLDADVTPDPEDEPRPSSGLTAAPLDCPTPQVIEVMSGYGHGGEASAGQPPEQTATRDAAQRHVLNQFTEVMLEDMRQIRDPMVLMRLRRDITDLVFRAVEEDMQRRAPGLDGVQLHGRDASQRASPQTNWRQKLIRTRNKGREVGRRTQRWEEVRHARRTRSRSPVLQPVQQGTAAAETANGPFVIVEAAEIKQEPEQETPPSV